MLRSGQIVSCRIVAAAQTMTPHCIRFDRYELQPRQRRLLCDGVEVPLRARAFDLLLVLAESAGELVTKSDLLDRVWAGLVVEENNIAAQVAALRKVLGGQCIATVPGRGYRFTAVVQAEAAPTATPVPAAPAPPAPVAVTATPTPAPAAVTPLFGRAAEARALAAALRAGVCVSLVGAGGVGKTALALEIAGRWRQGRMTWVDLTAIGDAAQLPGAIGRALGLQLAGGDWVEALVQQLAEGAQLLVLDNAEHLIEGVAAWAHRLGQALPGLALLVTSQLPLRIAGEALILLEPLPLPPADADADEVLASGAVAMLADRIRAADPRFVPAADAPALMRRICERLDGMPLALEMAAARAPLLGLQGLLDALDHRLELLRRGQRQSPSRHETLRAALEWSHGLLDEPERRLFRRLGAFAADFSLDLAVEVGADAGADHWEVVDRFSVLVERNLVASLHTDPPRYRLLDTLRAFAAEQLHNSGEADAVRRQLVHSLTAALNKRQAGTAVQRVAADLGLVSDALAWARQADPAAATRLALRASNVATYTTWFSEAAGWIASCEPLLGALEPALQALWWRELARLQTISRGGRALEAARRACALYRELGDDFGIFWSLIPLLRSAQLEGDEAQACRTEVQALSDRHPEWPPYNRVILHGSLAMACRHRGDDAGALAQRQREWEAAQQAGLSLAADNAENNIAGDLIELGRAEQALERIDALLRRLGEAPTHLGAWASLTRLNALLALERIEEAAAFAPQVLRWGRQFEVDVVFETLGRLAARQGRQAAAVQLFGHLRRLRVLHGSTSSAMESPSARQCLLTATDSLGAAEVQALLERGERLDDAAVERLLAGDRP